ncbi:hypothetical protein [Aquincola tertiaricarbonis]|uniref:hypothetical protein n=1 Tax=Aquincola tertiaricarbonis TaxID=391953 RepID=UPI0006152E8A|nr:hypothetical protein [Aquincola tertiaricarbonis]
MSIPGRGDPLAALARLLASVEAVRHGRALYTLLFTFSTAGLLLAMAGSSMQAESQGWAVLQGVAAIAVAFYGSNATGMLLMDQARGRAGREVADAVQQALRTGHRLLLVMLAAMLAVVAVLGVLAAGLYAARLPLVGPFVFAGMVPLGVVAVGLCVLVLAAVVGPLAGPAIWDGLDVRTTLRLLVKQARERLLFTALMVSVLGAMTAAVGALSTFVVVSGGRAVSALAVLVTGVELPPQQLMAGLFGFGLRSLGPAGAPVAQTPHGVAALVGGGMVFVLAIALPGLVYLRGVCALYLSVIGERRRSV